MSGDTKEILKNSKDKDYEQNIKYLRDEVKIDMLRWMFRTGLASIYIMTTIDTENHLTRRQVNKIMKNKFDPEHNPYSKQVCDIMKEVRENSTIDKRLKNKQEE